MLIVFIVCVLLVCYVYVGYPILLWMRSLATNPDISATPVEPSLTIVIAAYNEEKDIANKLELVLSLDYPAAKREIIVASDCSSDRTHEIVRSYSSRGIQLLELTTRGGKTAAQNQAVAASKGELIVFTDATTVIAKDALRHLIAPFSDLRVGCAGAQLEYQSELETAVGTGGGMYWSYEKQIKQWESDTCSLIGLSGCLYAVRRTAYRAIPANLISDFVTALDVYQQGLCCKYAPDALAFEKTNEDAQREFGMRSRVIVRSINALVNRAEMLNPFRYGYFAWQLWSHKVLRYLVPVFLIGILVSSAALAGRPGLAGLFFLLTATTSTILLVLVPIAYAVFAALGLRTKLLSAPFYFVHANAAALWGLISYLGGSRQVTWKTIR